METRLLLGADMIGVGVGIMDCAYRAAQAAASARGLTLDFKSGNVPALPGYAVTHPGARSEVDAGGTLHAYAANSAAILAGTGCWLRAAATNLLLNSTDLVGAAWSKSTGSPTLNTDALQAPDGTTTADRFRAGSGGAAEVWQTATRTVSPHVQVAFFKADGSGGRFPYIFLGGGANALSYFDTTNGVPATLSGTATGKSAGMLACSAAGWYMCWLLANATATSAAYGTGWSSTDGSVTAASGVGGYVWQQQLFTGSDHAPLIITIGSTVTSGPTALSVTCPNGTYTETTTYPDTTTQTRSITVSGSTYTAPVYPTVLTQPLVEKIVLT